ncbi:MAG: S-layer homology domain-containing protein, partial [Candidatus Limivicinus sp.]
FKNSGYCEKYVDCVMELLTQYGTYSPKPVEPEPVDPHLEACPTKDYQDVPQKTWYHEAVDYVVDTGIMTGKNGYFEPETITTRAMMVEALWWSVGAPQPDQLSPVEYSDISGTMSCANAVRWASQNGIVNGYPDGTFKPDQKVSRQELATILWRMAKVLGRDVTGGVGLEQFPDGNKVGSYALEAVQWAVGQGYIHGSDEGSQILLLPEGGATRAQMATILMRYCGGTATAPVTAAAPETVQEPNIDADGEDLEGN